MYLTTEKSKIKKNKISSLLKNAFHKGPGF